MLITDNPHLRIMPDEPATSSAHGNTRTIVTRAAIVGLMAGVVHIAYHVHTQDPYPGDFVWALRTAYTMLHGIDPYGFTPDPLFVPYPLPVVLFGLPFVWSVGLLPMYLPGATFLAVSSGLLAWSTLRAGEGWRLASMLLSGPYWMALVVSQWSPLIVAAWYIPTLAPLLVLIKPQIAFPIAVARRPSKVGILVAAAVLLLSLIIYPTWPLRFLSLIGPYQSIIPALTLPSGPLLFLAVLRWRDERARLLLLMAVMPQRNVYDFLPLWIAPRGMRNLLLLSLLSWVVVLVSLPTWPRVLSWPDMQWAVQVLYIPVLAMLLWPLFCGRPIWSSIAVPGTTKI